MTQLPPHHVPFADRYRASGDWIAGPVPDALARFARATPDKVALIDREGRLTYAELDALSRRFALALLARGVSEGDRVAIQLPNARAFVIAQQGALRIGAAYVPLLPSLRDHDVRQAIEVSRAKVLVVPGLHKSFDHAAMAAAMPVEDHFVVGGSFEAALDEDNGPEQARLEGIRLDPDSLRVVLFTSGTESTPKGVLHSYNSLYVGMKRHIRYFDLGADEVVMCASPVGHGTGAVNGAEFALHLGATLVLIEAWDPVGGLAEIRRHGGTVMWGATTFYTDLATAAEGLPPAPSFTWAFTAGAPVPRALPGLVRQRIGARLITAYGQSEGQNITICRPGDPPERLSSSDGQFHDCIEWKLVDADRRRLPDGAEGEIAYRGPNVCLGYLDPAHGARAFDVEGFIYSGDLGRVDRQGYLRITGRAKDIIIRGGENISPAEVEDLLFDQPSIEKVSVVGYADARLGERACAVVQPRGGATPSLADLVAHLAAKQVAKHKYPERLLIVDEMPMTPSGKVRKEALRALLLESPV